MTNNKIFDKLRKANIIFLILIILSMIIFINKSLVLAAPQGASITYNYTENASVRSADSHTAAGGSFTTLILNVTSQTSKWKAYVGNVTGALTLDNSNNMTIYNWALTVVQGEVYVSRNNSITFSSLTCANRGNITAEDTYLGINSSSDDSINKTFNQSIHKSFVIGGTGTIQNSTCFAIATYINDTSQPASENATFQEILLTDGTHPVFVAILNDNKQGFDFGNYDFQLIVPDNPTEVSTTYYFYAELG
jgi:hypothetical protein